MSNPIDWLDKFPKLTPESNKYTRGHAVVIAGGLEHSGAARLAAYAALRIGAGLVTVACPKDAIAVYASQLMAVMVKSVGGDFAEWIGDPRKNTVVIGPGSGVTEVTKKMVLQLLALGKNMVIDADAITVFGEDSGTLFRAIKAGLGQVIMTPHAGEFARVFGEMKVEEAAKASGACVLLKGAKTRIEMPDGRVVINDNAPPDLATAGSGDVLAGMIGGLLVQGMPSFEAACAGAWIHGEAGSAFGRGLISEDLVDLIPEILQKILK